MYKKRLMSIVLSVCMFISVIAVQPQNVEAAMLGNIGYIVSRGSETFDLLSGAVSYIREDEITAKPDKIYARWKNLYTSMHDNRLDLTFHVEDGITYVLSVENAKNGDIDVADSWQPVSQSEIMKVTLTVKDDTTSTSFYRQLSNNLKIYDTKTKSDLTLAPSIVVGDRRFKFGQAQADTTDTAAIFFMRQSTGFSITDNRNTKISFYWDVNSNFNVVVDSGLNVMSAGGKIFDFTLEGVDLGPNPNPNQKPFPTTTLYACTGYADSVEAIPYAEDDNDPNQKYPGFHLDIEKDPKAPDPAANPGVMLRVASPKFWNSTLNKFVPRNDTDLTFVMQLNLIRSNPSTYIRISNIYNYAADGSYTIPAADMQNVKAGSGAQRIVEDGEEYIVFKFADLDPGTIFDTAYLQLSCTKAGTPLLGITPIDLDTKTIFTYPQYVLTANGTDDFYMEITPFKDSSGKDVAGSYTIYEIDFSEAPYINGAAYYDYNTFGNDYYKLETRRYRAGDGKPIITLNRNAKALNSVWCWYFVTFDTESSPKKHLNSQFYHFKSDEKDVRLGTPEIAEPISSKVVSALNDQNELLLSIDWKMGMLSVIDNMFEKMPADPSLRYIDYVFKRGYKSEATANANDPDSFIPFMALRVTESTVNAKGYTVSLADDYVKYPYNKGLQFLTKEEDSFRTVPVNLPGQNYDNAYGRAQIKLPVYPIDSTGKPPNAFYFPDTCLIEAYGTYDIVNNNDEIETISTGTSVRKIITINARESMEVPTPQGFKTDAKSVSKTSFQLAWLPVSTTDYKSVEITPKQRVLVEQTPEDPDLPNSLTYNLYISTSKDKMTTLADYFRSDVSQKTTSFYGVDKSSLTQNLQDFINQTIVQATTSKTPILSSSVLDLTNTASESEIINVTVEGNPTTQPGLSALRNEKILKISNLSQSQTEFILNLAGLDENQVYYVMLETQVSPYLQQYVEQGLIQVPDFDSVTGLPIIIKDTTENPVYEETLILEEKTGFSKFSVMLTVTTTPEGENPDPSEIPPPSPLGVDKKNVTGNTATVFWNRMEGLSDKDYNGMKYQILRIRNDQLTNAQMNLNIPADKFLAQLDTKLEPFIWQTKGESNLLTFANNKFTDYDGGTTPSYVYITSDKLHELTDNSLKPNQLYMYYVRTVTVAPDDKNPAQYTDNVYSHSVWVPVSVTTDPVHAPINLKIEQEKVVNPKTSTVISFDAPITKDKLGTSNYFGISISEEGVELTERIINSTADINALIASATESAEKGHTHFEYTITGLKPGKSYMIKIRMYDIALGDWSPYSNTARTRTEVDDDDYDYNSDLDKWTKHYISQIEELLKKPLWQMSDPSTSLTGFVAEVRNSVFDAELHRATDGVVLLGQMGKSTQTYYIPLSAIQKANNAQKGFVISFGEQEIVIQKSTFDTATTKEIQNAQKVSSVADIFIKVDAAVSTYNTPVNSTAPLSPSINVTYTVIGTSTSEKQWDKDIYAQLESYVKNPSMLSIFNSLLGQQLNAKASNEQLVKFVDQQVNNVKQTLITITRNSFNGMINNSFTIGVTDKPFIVKSTVDDTAAAGGYYYQGGLWQPQPQTAQYGNKLGIISNLAGMYIFAGNKVVTPTIDGLQNIPELTSLYAKYGLNDYFGTDSAQINSSNASVGTAAGVAARLMGAAKSDDPLEYLKSKGYQITAANKSANIQTQQALYLLMAVYEQKTNTKIDTLKIKNYNATANITGIDPKYNRSVMAAVDLGLVDSEALQPRQAVTTGDFIKMLSQLAKKVKL